MNRIVEAWNRHQGRKFQRETEDSLEIEGEKKTFKVGGTMAALPKNEFRAVLNTILHSDFTVLKVIRTELHNQCKRVGISKHDLSAAVDNPKSKENASLPGFIKWCQSVAADDGSAIRQMVVVDATVCKRIAALQAK